MKKEQLEEELFLLPPDDKEKSLKRIQKAARRRHKSSRWIRDLSILKAKLDRKKSN